MRSMLEHRWWTVFLICEAINWFVSLKSSVPSIKWLTSVFDNIFLACFSKLFSKVSAKWAFAHGHSRMHICWARMNYCSSDSCQPSKCTACRDLEASMMLVSNWVRKVIFWNPEMEGVYMCEMSKWVSRPRLLSTKWLIWFSNNSSMSALCSPAVSLLPARLKN